VRISLICVGRSRGSPFADDVAHYERLLAHHAKLETHELREAGADPGRREELLRREGTALLERLPDGAFVCALDREGRPLSSPDLASWLEERRRSGRNLCFVIGGPLGLDRAVLERADERLSFGAATLPHQLARVVLLEQLFRAHKILAREPYHY
jgi:23S rRNA (pseudouridine1915-N3)-methyltransferase